MPWWSNNNNNSSPSADSDTANNVPPPTASSPQAPSPRIKTLTSKLSRTVNNLKPQPKRKHTLPSTFANAPTATSLFPPTDPAVDGDDCLHDCASCSVKYPSKFSIDEADKLYGFVNGWATHLVVATGKSDWVRDVADERGSVMEAVGKSGVAPANGKLMLSASNLPVPDDAETDGHDAALRPGGRTRVLLLPAWQWFDGVGPAQVPDLVRNHIDKAATNTTPFTPAVGVTASADAAVSAGAAGGAGADIDKATTAETETDNGLGVPSQLTPKAIPYKYLIMMCSQKTRDARCGQSAPLLYKEFARHLRAQGLFRDLSDERPGGVGMFFISHVGGHKYSANIMVYRRGDAVLEGVEAREKERAEKEEAEKKKKAWEKEKGANVVNGGIFGESEREADVEEAERQAMTQAGQCIWLARVRPEDCENIVKYTLLQGKVVKPERQLRGGFDRCRGLTSW